MELQEKTIDTNVSIDIDPSVLKRIWDKIKIPSLITAGIIKDALLWVWAYQALPEATQKQISDNFLFHLQNNQWGSTVNTTQTGQNITQNLVTKTPDYSEFYTSMMNEVADFDFDDLLSGDAWKLAKKKQLFVQEFGKFLEEKVTGSSKENIMHAMCAFVFGDLTSEKKDTIKAYISSIDVSVFDKGAVLWYTLDEESKTFYIAALVQQTKENNAKSDKMDTAAAVLDRKIANAWD